ncbi:hypothetical protein BSCH_01375 [Candidatus Paraburkholderia schumanniana]|nr:hypothetical protein BSCH_01375 [Candidatus Paraburkholderia schumannianae]
MKPYLCAAASLGAFAQPAQKAAQSEPQSATQKMSPEEAAGLPDLKSINRPPANVSSKVEISPPRTPSYHELSTNGTEITEYRDKGKPVEIDVRSNFGTRYQMSAPAENERARRHVAAGARQRQGQHTSAVDQPALLIP